MAKKAAKRPGDGSKKRKPTRPSSSKRVARPGPRPKPGAPATGPAKAPAPRRPARERVPPPEVVLEFERTVALFNQRDWRAAAERFKAIRASFPHEADILDRVQAYLRICERNLAAPAFEPRNAEEHYQVGILRLNAGALDEAVRHFQRAVGLDRRSDKAQYALAAALALGEDRAGAMRHLRLAIELNPDNRVFAANDSDLDLLRDEADFVELVGRPRRRERDEPQAQRDESE